MSNSQNETSGGRMDYGLQITDAFIVMGSEPIRERLSHGQPALSHSHTYALGDYVPRWARRRRLRRLRPMVRRAEVAMALWRWSRGKQATARGFYYSFPSDRPDA